MFDGNDLAEQHSILAAALAAKQALCVRAASEGSEAAATDL